MNTKKITKARIKEALLKALKEEPEQETKEKASEFLLFLCLKVIMAIGAIYFLRNDIYCCGVCWREIEAFVQGIVK